MALVKAIALAAGYFGGLLIVSTFGITPGDTINILSLWEFPSGMVLDFTVAFWIGVFVGEVPWA